MNCRFVVIGASSDSTANVLHILVLPDALDWPWCWLLYDNLEMRRGHTPI